VGYLFDSGGINDMAKKLSAIIFQVVKYIPAALILWCYSYLCFNVLGSRLEFHEQIKKNVPVPDPIGHGEFIGYSAIFLVIVGCFFLLTGLGLAIGIKAARKIYLWLIVIIVAETIAVFTIA
jgi:hypothetical protein